MKKIVPIIIILTMSVLAINICRNASHRSGKSVITFKYEN